MIITATAQGIYSCSHTVQRHGFNRYKIPTEQVVLIYISFFTHTDVKISMVLLASHSLSLFCWCSRVTSQHFWRKRNGNSLNGEWYINSMSGKVVRSARHAHTRAHVTRSYVIVPGWWLIGREEGDDWCDTGRELNRGIDAASPPLRFKELSGV